MSRVDTGDAPQEVLQAMVPAQPLEISDQREGAITLTAPSNPKIRLQLQGHIHLNRLPSKSLKGLAGQRVQPQTAQACGQSLGVAQNGWQDGEMGQGR